MVKTMYAVANAPTVELFVNEVLLGRSSTPTDDDPFNFSDVNWASGTIKAVGYDDSRATVAQHQLQTAETTTAFQPSPTVGPEAFQAAGILPALAKVTSKAVPMADGLPTR